MFEGYIRVAAATPTIKVADCDYNAKQILALIKKADQEQVRLLCLPELCITGYTCGDLFLQDSLINAAKKALQWLVDESKDYNVLAIVGLPLPHNGKLYNVAAVLCKGTLLGFVPKSHIPNYSEFYELRHFAPAPNHFDCRENTAIPFAKNILFCCKEFPDFKLAVEICEDLWTPAPPSIDHAIAGATVIVNLSASSERMGKADYRRSLIAGQSARLVCGYIYANAGYGESTTDIVFSGHNIICENGDTLQEAPPFGDGWAVTEIDISALIHNRRKVNTYFAKNNDESYTKVFFSLDTSCPELSRFIDHFPFIPFDKKGIPLNKMDDEYDNKMYVRFEEILNIQAAGLAKRLEHTNCQSIVLGVSGGLDSTLALLAAVRACKMIEKPTSDILAVTMPCFGTTERTRNNAHRLCEAFEIPCKEIDITQSVIQHLHDIGHPEDKRDIVFENAQARIRTLVLMNLANQTNGLVLGTGNLSELALGWATYNGDHMSMYGINAGIPKTLVRNLVGYVWFKHTDDNKALSDVLLDITDTPISPELLPPQNGKITQHTEDIIGPYELHDFFIYHVMCRGRSPKTIFHLACIAFKEKHYGGRKDTEGNYHKGEIYTPDVILKWLNVFYQRFFSQQFKRSCLPDGPKIVSISLSPRGDWRMPSDAVCSAWLDELNGLQNAEN
ncbi:MAG: NAD(+) synthase [Defluviitaleaceae bacterium]|nr:NAD(+) synthase [Defluviitaleaceae bacterium]